MRSVDVRLAIVLISAFAGCSRNEVPSGQVRISPFVDSSEAANLLRQAYSSQMCRVEYSGPKRAHRLEAVALDRESGSVVTHQRLGSVHGTEPLVLNHVVWVSLELTPNDAGPNRLLMCTLSDKDGMTKDVAWIDSVMPREWQGSPLGSRNGWSIPGQGRVFPDDAPVPLFEMEATYGARGLRIRLQLVFE